MEQDYRRSRNPRSELDRTRRAVRSGNGTRPVNRSRDRSRGGSGPHRRATVVSSALVSSLLLRRRIFAVAAVAVFALSRCAASSAHSDGASGEASAAGEAAAQEESAGSSGSSGPAPAVAVRNAEEFLQYQEGFPAGCEPISLALALRSLGFDITPKEFIDGYVVADPSWTDPSSYWGSPYDTGASFPPGMVNAANAYLEEQGSSMRAVDATGTDFAKLRDLAAQGVPVLIWTTVSGNPPNYSGESVGGRYAWYLNEHCVLMCGAEGDCVLVSDPLAGLLDKDAESFGSLYEACGSYALYIMDGMADG